mmetsp:Transcript_19389/g.33317  ORF Transcript_19389/g.33317 Transcript_19389/m.33317 type:complete len:873 (+) Transcript_19389:55-2673(+)|eukprot:CAMPEP_0196656630 /NCGR_PEP_ID=MMETSP1086-20130531/18974_1 /TAXON_ID=77921 /ORGANISM="Cyanoptyche  gloeocystis , Strain SAG4.97" /LENGTH=872 /DNA_ID=CAMNT_0041989465 /DNA_START=54 /DNA_END=2672 /DNA_ORIENTATION=-
MADLKADAQRVLLPTNVRPKHYSLQLEPDIAAFTFKGQVEIDIEVVVPSTEVTLHAAELKVFTAEYVLAEGPARQASEIVLVSDKNQNLLLRFAEALPAGPAKLKMTFEGILNDRMHGFYRSKYTIGGETRYMATTQFEATDARRAFPCWDEPSLKATFDVVLVVPADRTAISNMPETESKTLPDGKRLVRFARTPIMSTYLLAFVVGEFDFIAGTTAEGVSIRIFTPVGKTDLGTFALEVALKSLSYFSTYFAIPYPLPKIDCLAIPDFAAGAMENWGCVTFREIAVLIDPVNSSAAMKQRVAEVVAHELAHQWFGNLVTMEWWTDLWLNEGFATWAAFLAVEHIFPEWHIWKQFVCGNLSRALTLDGLQNSHPIEVEVKSSGEIDEIFDAISYSKGASVIRMLANYVGHDDFRKGLQIYLDRHQYKNARTDDLWVAIGEASGKPISEIMHSWTKQTGYPVVKLTEHPSNDPGKRVLGLEQMRFLSSGQVLPEDKGKTWWVPIGFTSKNCKEPTYAIFHDTLGCASLPDPDANSWIKGNSAQSGVYRVRYDPDTLKKLLPAIASKELEPVDRLGIAMDSFALSKAGMMSTADLLELWSAYKQEDEYTVLLDIASNIDELSMIIANEPFFGKFQAFVRDLFQPTFQRLGWDNQPNDSHSTILLRTLALSVLARFGEPEVVAEAKRRLQLFLKDQSSVIPDIRGIIFSATVRHGGDEDYDTIMKIMGEADLHEEKIRCMRSLGSASKAPQLQRTLKFSISDDCRSQDTVYVIGAVTSNPLGPSIAWEFLKEHFTLFENRYSSGMLFSSIISSVTKNLIGAEKAADVHKFFEEHPVSNAARSVKQSIETILSSTHWRDAETANLASWLEKHVAA